MQIVITGASKGIGLAIAERFLDDREGHTLILCARNEEVLKTKSLELQARFPRTTIHAFGVDMSKKEEIFQFAEAINNIGVTDILINNAGQFVPGSCYEEPEGQLEKMITANLYSAYQLTRALLPAMLQQGRGHIFNMCSIASLHAYSNGGSYSISKFALAGFTQNLREELKPKGIKVTGVYPGATLTGSWEGVDIAPERIMEAKDIAAMVYTAAHLSPQAVVEDIVLRPQLGDL
ncbi:MAG: short-chain dehydrogenase [Pseudopedobacter saltans]|uniref:Short-chain dehydrogenase n=1 Tax=Pseudopedobacter saltans TaxID=151895 RepID=A0A2W5FE55_9SPHI|nr:MAG: short-chain dehydrogenase [Pseudopedobacter saltans]